MSFEAFEERPRESEDAQETRDQLKALIEGGTINQEVVLAFFNYACKAYKGYSLAAGVSDNRIQVEFQYAARALATLCLTSDVTVRNLALLDVFQASRHIINDALDLTLYEIDKLIDEAQDIVVEHPLEYWISDFDQQWALRVELEEIVMESRRQRGLYRHEQYLSIVSGDKFAAMLRFLRDIQKAIVKVGQENLKKSIEDRRWAISLTIGVPALVLTVISLVLTMLPRRAAQVGDFIDPPPAAASAASSPASAPSVGK